MQARSSLANKKARIEFSLFCFLDLLKKVKTDAANPVCYGNRPEGCYAALQSNACLEWYLTLQLNQDTGQPISIYFAA